MEALNTINTVMTYAFIYGGTPAQGLFVFLFFLRPWKKYRPTRALMTKSFSLFLLMSQSLIVLHLYGMRPLDWPAWLLVYRVIGDTFMLFAIYYQLIALIREMLAGYRSDMVVEP